MVAVYEGSERLALYRPEAVDYGIHAGLLQHAHKRDEHAHAEQRPQQAVKLGWRLYGLGGAVHYRGVEQPQQRGVKGAKAPGGEQQLRRSPDGGLACQLQQAKRRHGQHGGQQRLVKRVSVGIFPLGVQRRRAQEEHGVKRHIGPRLDGRERQRRKYQR